MAAKVEGGIGHDVDASGRFRLGQRIVVQDGHIVVAVGGVAVPASVVIPVAVAVGRGPVVVFVAQVDQTGFEVALDFGRGEGAIMNGDFINIAVKVEGIVMPSDGHILTVVEVAGGISYFYVCYFNAVDIKYIEAVSTIAIAHTSYMNPLTCVNQCGTTVNS